MRLYEVVANVGLDDGLGLDDVVAFFAGVGTILATLGVIFRKPLGQFFRFLDWAEKFQEDWDGRPARPGRDSQPGVMERLNRIDGEFNRNGGSTLKDAQFRTERAVEELAVKVDATNRGVRRVRHNQAVTIAAQNRNLHAIQEAFAMAGHEVPAFEEIPLADGIMDDDDHKEVSDGRNA